jgi:low affinity Fe/Cu permease
MRNFYRHSENGFEKLVSLAIVILGNSITFLLALGIVILWLTSKEFYAQSVHAMTGDVILGIAFLSLFIIQKSFNRFSASLQLKLNELLASHEPAKNSVINAEERTEHEIIELSKEYAELARQENEDEAQGESNK